MREPRQETPSRHILEKYQKADTTSFLEQMKEYERSTYAGFSPPRHIKEEGTPELGPLPEDRKRTIDSVIGESASDGLESDKPKKRRLLRKECNICCADIAANRYPKAPHSLLDGIKQHCRSVCFSCFENHINAQLDDKEWDKITCPECNKILEEPEIKKLDRSFAGRVYQKWLDKVAKSYMVKAEKDATIDDEKFQACPAEGCGWGCFMSVQADGNIFRCQMCKYRFCLVCESTMHEDETCDQYQKKRLEEQHHKDDLLSTEAVKECSKPCPGCGINLDKWTGCDHVTCKKCKHEFCWVCFVSYNGPAGVRSVGNSAHTNECKYHTNRLPSYAGGGGEDEGEIV